MINKNAAAAIIGAVFECYNNALYGFFAVTLAPLFFPHLTYLPETLASFSAFAAGFILRPMGGAIFGYIGDRWGRKTTLKITALLTAIPALIIGIIPTYQDIGILAPIVLFSCRLIQGIAVGSDYTGALIVIFEQNEQKNKRLITSLLVALGFLGGALGVAVAVISTLSFMPPWGWRIPFILGGLSSLFAFYLRRSMEETVAYSKTLKENKIARNPLSSLLKSNRKQFFICCIFGGTNLVPIYIATVYMNLDLRDLLHFSTANILFNNFILLLFGAVIVLCSGKLITKYGEVVIIKICMYWFILFSLPMFIWAFREPSTYSLFLLQLFIMVGDAPQIAALVSLVPKLFQTEGRYSAVGLSFAIGQALIGGMTPIFASCIVIATNQIWAPGYLLLFSSLIYLAALYYAEKYLSKSENASY